MSLREVKMRLTEQDEENAKIVAERTQAKNKAHAVGIALALTRAISDILEDKPSAKLQLRFKDGRGYTISMPEIEKLERSS